MNVKINLLEEPARVPLSHWLLPGAALISLLTAVWRIASQVPPGFPG